MQSARWPDSAVYEYREEKRPPQEFKEKCDYFLTHMGYGIPDVQRAIRNDPYRITLFTPDTLELEARETNIFKIPIPQELRDIGEGFDILLEVTLSYSAMPSRTRRTAKKYLSTWLDWTASRNGESSKMFEDRVLNTGKYGEDEGEFKWFVENRKDRGYSKSFSRQNGTIQKDWCVLKSYQLSDYFCIAVKGHSGWAPYYKAKYSLVVSFEVMSRNLEIYQLIRNEINIAIENKEIEIRY